MKYLVLEGPAVRWPNGQIRAQAGQVFEAYDDHENPEVTRKAKVYLRGQKSRCVPEPRETISVGCATIPEEFFQELREASAKPRKAPAAKTPKIAKKVSKMAKPGSYKAKEG